MVDMNPLDISAAFDMISHYTLFSMLQTIFGIYGMKSLSIFIEVRWLASIRPIFLGFYKVMY